MTALRAAALELLGLFVDDWPTTAAVIAWLLIAAVALPHVPGPWRGASFFCGIAVVLIASVAAGARKAKSP